jgi:hypothetical protein
MVAISQNTIKFDYDGSGNLSQRYLQVLPDANLRHSANSSKDTTFKFNVFPNPGTDFVNVEGDLPAGENNALIIVYDPTGKEVKRENYGGKRKTVDFTEMNAGIYILKINSGKKELAGYKVIINK